MGKILLFYKYVHLEMPGAIAKWQKKLCQDLGLTGRIIIATEGINGTVGGSIEATQAYIDAMNAHENFKNIDFKTAEGNENHFPRMRVVVKEEIVKLGIDPQKLTVDDGGKHLTPEEAHELLNKKSDDLVIIDTRNNYESRIGTIPGSWCPDKKYFREFPEYIDERLEDLKDKTVLMFCTGGIRCERASGYVKNKGIAKEVYQIEGGIHRYIEKFPDGHFRGSNYVFDARVSHRVNNDILSTCDLCSIPCDYYINCINARCNKMFLGCDSCIKMYKECCSQSCFDLVTQGKVNVRVKPARLTEISSQKQS